MDGSLVRKPQTDGGLADCSIDDVERANGNDLPVP